MGVKHGMCVAGATQGMPLREQMIQYSKGDRLRFYWWLFAWRSRTASGRLRAVQTFWLNRIANRHGGYIGPDTVFLGRPLLPHGLHGVFISRFASIGEHCCIYQNVTIGEVGRAAPRIGHHCLIGAGAVIIGGISVGSHVKIGAGAVVSRDIPDHCTVVAQPPLVIVRK